MEARTSNHALTSRPNQPRLLSLVRGVRNCSKGYLGSTACEQKIQRPENFVGVTYPRLDCCPGHASRVSASAVLAFPFARGESFSFDTRALDWLLGSLFRVAINP